MNETHKHTTAKRKCSFLFSPRRNLKHDCSLRIVFVDSFYDLFSVSFCNVMQKNADVFDNIAGCTAIRTYHRYSLIEPQFV